MHQFKKAIFIGATLGSVIILSPAYGDSSATAQAEVAKIKESLAQPWTPPAREESSAAIGKKRSMRADVVYGRANVPLPETPTNAQLTHLDALPEPLLRANGTASRQERTALASALRSYMSSGDAEDIEPLVEFTQTYPRSIWTPGLQLNLGMIAYDTGYFSGALTFWRAAWDGAKDQTDEHSVAVANRAIAEYAKMCARIGRKEDLATLFTEVEGRVFQGLSLIHI